MGSYFPHRNPKNKTNVKFNFGYSAGSRLNFCYCFHFSRSYIFNDLFVKLIANKRNMNNNFCVGSIVHELIACQWLVSMIYAWYWLKKKAITLEWLKLLRIFKCLILTNVTAFKFKSNSNSFDDDCIFIALNGSHSN